VRFSVCGAALLRGDHVGASWQPLQYKKASDFYHEHCAYHFQADVMPYTCLYSRLWWCVGLGTFIHMSKRADGENRTNPW
jgi:hypothetical protein